MDLLRFLMLLPERFAQLMRRFFRMAGNGMRQIFGSLSWAPPAWLPKFIALVRSHPREFSGGALGFVLSVALCWGGWVLYSHQPRPPEPSRITFEVHAPGITDYQPAALNKPIVIHPLDVDFSDSAAPIELVGKTVTSGISMDPALKGTWTWVDDKTLRFMPAADWPVGVHVEVEFNVKQAFAPQVLMADDQFAFDMPAFTVTAGQGEFYQDPQNPTAKKTIMPLDFNYPVDPTEFEKRVALALIGRDGKSNTPVKFTVTYDAVKLKAFVHSQPLDLPRDDDTMQLTLDSGVRSSRGGDATKDSLKMSVGVPGLYSLTLGDVTPTLVNNDKYEPEQVMVVSASDAVRGSDMEGGVKAWVLPKRKPGRKQADSAPPYAWSSDEVGDNELKQSQSVKLELVPTEKEFSELQSFKFNAEPGQRVYVRFANGLKSFGGYILGKPSAQTFTVPNYPSLLRFMADGSLLSLSGDKRISVVSRNVTGMQMEIGRVLPDQLQHLVTFNDGNYSKPELNGQFTENSIVERFKETRVFARGRPGEAHYEGFDLGQYLRAGRHGVFLLHLSTYTPPKNGAANPDADTSSDYDRSEPSDTRMVVVTDLGMLAKRAVDGSRDVFVQSIRTGQPVGGATVSVLALNGQTLFTDVSSADGQVHFPTLKGLNREKRPVMYLVEKGDDLSFLPIDGYDRTLDYSRFDIGGEVNAATEGDLSGYLFSDRGIYRPGDRFHVGVIVRTASWAKSPAGIPLQAEIVDPRGRTVKKVPVSVDASGFTELDYAPDETAPTGTWSVNLYIIGKNDQETAIGSTTVSVKEFLPDTMKVDASLSDRVADGWVKPAALKGLVDAHNLFGTPAADRRVEASLTLNPTFPAFKSWAEYQFFDLRHAKDGYTTQLQDGQTDDKGHAEFDLDLKKYADATYRLDFLAKAYEAGGGRSVAATATTLVSSNPWLVGYKSVDDLNYITRNTPRSVRLVAIDPTTKSIELKGLEARLIERRYVSVLTKQDSGVYKYESKPKEVLISSSPLNIPAGGMDYVLPTDKAGDYALVVRSGNLDVNRVEYSVTGDANISRSLDRNAELQIKLNKQDYAPGEAIEISLRAPYEGSGLITIERDKVYAHAWFTSHTSNSVQHITVPKGFEGNGYINVQYIRDPSSDEIFTSPLSYGVATFSVNVDARRNPITVDAPDLVKPGETVSFKLHTAHPTKVVLFAVDEGILQVAHYKLGDPLKFFFRKRMLEVQTSQILDLILPDFKKLMAAAAPGGDGGDALGRQLNPFKRQRDKPVAYWSGIVDVTGDKTFQYTVPDYFHGRLHVMAIAVSPDLIGTYEGATTVRGDFVLSPNAPTTLAPGDEAEVSVGVSNNLTGTNNNPVPIAVALKAGPQFQILGNTVQIVSLAPAHEGVVYFRVKATATLGSGDLAFTASAGGKSARQSIDVSIRPASAFRTQLNIARLSPGSNTEIANLRSMYDAYSRRDASISTAPLVLSQGLTDLLINYDNFCSEQIVSAVMPRLIAQKWTSVPAFSQALQPVLMYAHGYFQPLVGKGPAPDPIAAQIDVLRSRQNEEGGFGLWTATPDSEPFISAYVMNFLLEARDRGAAVPKEMIDSGNEYLQQLAADDAMNSLEEMRQRAYAVYLLTRQGNVTTNNIAAVQKRLQAAFPKQWKTDLAAAWLAASYKMLKQDKEADALIAGPQSLLERSTDDGSYDYYFYYDPLTRDASVLYLLAKHFPERAKALSPRVMDNIARPLQRNLFNTLSASMTMLALDVYAASTATAVEKLGIDEIHADRTSKPIAALQNKLLQAGTWSGATTQVRFTDGSTLPAWYVVNQSGYDRDVSPTVIKNGLEIVREYTDSKGKLLTQIKLGDEIDVHIKIRSTAQKGFGDVAITDLLPGGFDPVITPPPEPVQAEGEDSNSAPPTPSFGLPTSSWLPIYSDVREDRVVIYGFATPEVQEFVYRIKASSAGKFVVPQVYGESMYDRRIQARSAGGNVLTVTRPN